MKIISLLLLLLFFTFTGCRKDQEKLPSNSRVEFYLLKSFARNPGSAAIIEGSSIMSDTALIQYKDILWYNPREYTFKVSAKTAHWLNDQYALTHGKPFALAIDRKIIYTGYFWASFSSSGCDWVVIDPLNISGENELKVRLGYPGILPGMSIPDNRNNTQLLETLSLDGKLKAIIR
jgi:hypothetical protein